MQPLELLAVNYAIDRANRLYSLTLCVPRESMVHPVMMQSGEKLYSYVTARPVKIADEELICEPSDKVLTVKSRRCLCTLGGSIAHRHIASCIITAFDGVAGDVVTPLIVTVLAAKEAYDNPQVLVNYIDECQEADTARTAEITELKGRIALLSAAKE